MNTMIIQKFLNRIKLLIQNPSAFYEKTYRQLAPMQKEYRRRFNMKLDQWLLYHQREIALTHKCHWMGVCTVKTPLDLWIYQEILYEVQPDIVVEIGSAYGGSTLYFANLFDISGKGKVISVDIDRTLYKVKHDRIIEITGNSSSPEVVEKVSELCQRKSVLVIQDGDHSKQQVLNDLENYSNLVTMNSYFIVEDGTMDLFKPGDGFGSYEKGPLEAIDEFISKNLDFVIDRERERYILTQNPKGFLKRIR